MCQKATVMRCNVTVHSSMHHQPLPSFANHKSCHRYDDERLAGGTIAKVEARHKQCALLPGVLERKLVSGMPRIGSAYVEPLGTSRLPAVLPDIARWGQSLCYSRSQGLDPLETLGARLSANSKKIALDRLCRSNRLMSHLSNQRYDYATC